MTGQELNCLVEVNTSRIEGSSQSIFNTLRNAVEEYMNTTSFTQFSYRDFERIDCRLLIDIQSYNNDNFTARIQIQSSRPVFNSNYVTPLLNYIDNSALFEYVEYEPIVFKENNVQNELEALLNFYAYMILGTDADSFSLKGGEDSFRKARNIVMQMQNSADRGWSLTGDNRNRAALLNAFTDAGSSPFRDLIYSYHREGLDEMSISIDKGRNNILETISTNLEKIYSTTPFSLNLILFHDSKLDETIRIFKEAPPHEKSKIKKTLSEIYPADRASIENI